MSPALRRSGLWLLIVSFFAIALVLLMPARALAHGGPFNLTVTPDGSGGISVVAEYAEDGHPVTEIMDPVATAVASDGRTAGPVELVSSSEGEGVWVSPEPFLEDGDWTVTVEVTTPASSAASAEFTVAPLAPPVEPGEELPAASDAVQEAPADQLGLWLWVAVGVAVVGVGTAWFVLGRRRATGPVEPGADAAKPAPKSAKGSNDRSKETAKV